MFHFNMVLKVGYIESRKKNNPNIQQTVLVHVDFEIHVYYIYNFIKLKKE